MEDAERMLLPMMALIGWTLLVLLLIPYKRLKAGFSGELKTDDFRFGESARVSGAVSLPNRNYMNLLESPLLFYGLCLVHVALERIDGLAVGMAWLYVGLRVLHSLIHLSYNHVVHRLVAFAASNVVLTLLWGRLLLQMV